MPSDAWLLFTGGGYPVGRINDALGRLASVASRENEVHFDYRTHGSEPAGWRWQRNGDQVAAVAVSRDAWDDVVGISFGNVGDMHRMDFRHDTAGRLDKAEFADGHSWLYGYDRLYQVVFAQRVETSTGTPVENGSFHYEYDGAGNRLSSQDGSTAARRHYASNSLNQYASIAATGVIPIRGRADEDASGAVTATVDGDATVYTPTRNGQDFAVDIPVDNSAGSVTAHIAVDAVKHDGTLDQELKRRLSGDYVVPAAVTETLSYDADGNMLSQDGWTYAWNGEDRLVAASKGTLRLEFVYDYLGRRFEKKVYRDDVLSAHSLFVYNGLRQIAEYDALNGNALRNAYLRRPTGTEAPLLRNGTEFYIPDARGNIAALVDETGAIIETYAYDPFGNCIGTGTSTNPFRFSSEFHDDETGLVYYNYRFLKEEFANVPMEILKEHKITVADDGTYLYHENPDRKYSYEIFFRARHVGCNFCLDKVTNHFVLSMFAH